MMEKILYHLTINNLSDLAYFLGCEPTEHHIARRIYKDTECGAWIQFYEDGIQVGSIVEGSDAEFTMERLFFPFSTETLFTQLEELENLVEDKWNEEHSEDELHLPWSYLGTARMQHEGEEFVEELIELQDARGFTVAYVVWNTDADRILKAINGEN